LHVPAAGGVYGYGAGSVFPNNTFNATNYWVDVVFTRPWRKTGATSVTAALAPQSVNWC